MTNEDKRAWLDWAVEIGLLEFKDFPYLEWINENSGLVVARLGRNKHIELAEMEQAIIYEIAVRGWLLTQEDVAQWDRERQSFKIKHDCYIRYVDIQTSKFIGEVHEAESRLDALMEAFRESVEAEG